MFINLALAGAGAWLGYKAKSGLERNGVSVTEFCEMAGVVFSDLRESIAADAKAFGREMKDIWKDTEWTTTDKDGRRRINW
jgi:hypothetical protein